VEFWCVFWVGVIFLQTNRPCLLCVPDMPVLYVFGCVVAGAVVSPPSGLSKVTGFHLGCLKVGWIQSRATRFDFGCLSLNLCYDI
jgi:hypothetical protein